MYIIVERRDLLKKSLPTLIKAYLAGIIVSIGASSYLLVENKNIGILIFGIGLFTIYVMEMYLFTGKIGYLPEDKNPGQLAVIFLANSLGTISGSLALLQTKLPNTTEMVEYAHKVSMGKIEDSYLSVFILAIFCGMLMYVAAYSYRKTKDTPNAIMGAIIVYLCVVAFLYAGYDHSVANTVYFTIGGAWSLEAVITLLVSVAGNSVGSIIFGLAFKYLKSVEH